jgi:hypothetical protein
MRQVTVQKDDLMEIVKANRDEHRTIFEKAVEGYRKRAIEILEEHIERIKHGKVERVVVQLPVPQDHTADYDRVLKMLDMSVDDEVTLDEQAFAEYVMDDWHWQRQFLTDSSSFTALAAAKLDRLNK